MPDPHITIPDENPIIQYTVGGSPDDEFTFPFSYFTSADILVYDGDDLVSSSDYTVTGTAGTTGGYDGGTVLLDTPVSNTVITIIRDVAIARTTDFPVSGPFNITSLNTQLDKIFAIEQQHEGALGRRISIPDTDDTGITTELPAAADRANKALIFNADGDVTVSTDDYEDQVADVQAIADAAQASADDAAASASAAATSASAASTSATSASTSATTATNAKNAALAAQTAAELAETHAETAETNAETAQGLAEDAQAAAETAQGLAEDWADKTSGAVDGSEFSSKAYAVGGTGVTATSGKGAAKEWATKTSAAVDTSEFSAKEYAQGTQASTGGSSKNWAQQTGADVTGAAANSRSAKSWAQDANTGATLGGSAKDWAQTTGATVDGTNYAAKEHAVGTTVTTGSAKDWASKTSAQVASTDTSAKGWAIGATGISDGAAKNWAQQTGADVTGAAAQSRSAKSWAQDDLHGSTYGGSAKDWAQSASKPDGTLESAKTYATNAASSASSASTSASTATTQASNASSSASSASTSASTATTQASNASTSATNAAASAAAAAATLASASWRDVKFKTFSDSPITLTSADNGCMIRIDTSGGAVTVNLPTISGLTMPFHVGIKKETSDTNAITINRGGASDLIDSATSKSISASGASTVLIADTDPSPDEWTSADFGAIAGNRLPDLFSGTGAQTNFTLSAAPGSVGNVDVYVSGVYQRPTTDYSVSGTTLTFVSAPASGTNNVATKVGTTLSIGTPADGTVTTAKIVDNNVTLAKLATQAANTILAEATGSTAVPAAVAVAANKFLARSSTGNIAAKDLTDFALTLLDDADASTMRTTLGITTAGGSRALSGTDTVVASDNGKLLTVSGTCALALTAAATVGNFTAFVKNTATTGVQIITITPNGSENLDGSNSTLVMLPGEMRSLSCNGTAWVTAVIEPFKLNITTTATPVLPRNGYQGVSGQLWGGGGSGGAGATNGGGGGGGGGFNQFTLMTGTISVASLSLTCTIGAGGPSQTSANTAGTAGGLTTVVTGGSFQLSQAYGGGAGGGGSLGAGGGGGGTGNNTTTPSTLGVPGATGVGGNAVTTTAGAGGGDDRGMAAGTGSGAAGGGAAGQQYAGGGGGNSTTNPGGWAYNGGGGGGVSKATTGAAGGNSIYGGGGGGGASNVTGGAGGGSVYGGAGGAGGNNGAGTGGAVGGGGGGGAVGTAGSGAGGGGRIILEGIC